MQKIMFNDRYGLTQAVLEGKKTMTRRIIPIDLYNQTDWKAFADGDFEVVVDGEGYYHDIRNCGKYRVGEEVAIAQAYQTLRWPALPGIDWKAITEEVTHSKGWTNKMFVKTEYMPHRIRITNIKVERLQDISGEDAMREGIEEHYPYIKWNPNDKLKSYRFRDKKSKYGYYQLSPVRDCFAELINRVSGKGTWERNPWVFVYEFELLK